MKKFIMTAIVICLSIATAIPFNSAKAATTLTLLQKNVNVNYGTTTIGAYHTYGINSSSNGYIDVSSYGIFNADDTYKSGTMIYIGFNDICSGDLTITFSGSITGYQYIVPQGDGVGRWNINVNNGRINVYWENTNAFIIYCFTSTYQSTPTAQVGGLVVNHYRPRTENTNTYVIPNYSLSAYEFAADNKPIVYNAGDIYPHYEIENYDQSKVVAWDSDIQYVFLFGSTKQASLLNYQFSDLNISSSIQYNISMDGFYIYTMYIQNTIQNSSTFAYMTWGNSFDLYPLYFGDVNNVPDELYSYLDGLTYSQYLDEISMYLFQIRNLLQQSYNDQGQTSQDISNIADDFGDIADDEHQISTGFQDDLDDFKESIDLQDYDFLTGIANASEYFKIQLENVFNNSVNLRAMWVLPVICIVLLRLLGG